MILGHHGGEVVLFAAAGGVGALPALYLLLKAQVRGLRTRLGAGRD